MDRETIVGTAVVVLFVIGLAVYIVKSRSDRKKRSPGSGTGGASNPNPPKRPH